MICRIQWYAFCQHSFMDLPDIFHGMESISNKGPYNFHTMDFHTMDSAVGPLKLSVYTTLNFWHDMDKTGNCTISFIRTWTMYC